MHHRAALSELLVFRNLFLVYIGEQMSVDLPKMLRSYPPEQRVQAGAE